LRLRAIGASMRVGLFAGADDMESKGVSPHGEALRKAVHWLSQQPERDRAVINEAGQRFDLTPLEQQFLARYFGPLEPGDKRTE
jgi:hypothetical protein